LAASELRAGSSRGKPDLKTRMNIACYRNSGSERFVTGRCEWGGGGAGADIPGTHPGHGFSIQEEVKNIQLEKNKRFQLALWSKYSLFISYSVLQKELYNGIPNVTL
jgi:hypothetical protein